jgi:GTP cyclohydrolase IA
MEATITVLPCASRRPPAEKTAATKFATTVASDSHAREVDVEKISRAITMILEAIGEDTERAGLVETPARVARMYQELCYSVGLDAASEITCKFNEGTEGLVIVKDIAFTSLCEHHLIPFSGVAHIAYLPSEGVITGLSKLARVVELTARRLQVQERMTEEIADAILTGIEPKAVCVMLEAEHMCMSMRGIKKPGSRTLTTAFRGQFDIDKELRSEVLALLK